MKTRIQISSCVHEEDPKILTAWLEGISGLVNPPDCDLSYKFILHNPCGGEVKLIEKHLPTATIKVLHTDVPAAAVSDRTHNWSVPLVAIVSSAKNDLIREALDSKADYLFFVDSDQILRPRTLNHLLEQGKDLIGNVTWTVWNPGEPERPNAWLWDHYGFAPNTMELLRKPGIYPVGFIGGILLISRAVLEDGVSYKKIPNLTMKLEDRWFHIRAAVMGYQTYISTIYPSLHLYRKEDLERLDVWKASQKVV